MDKELEEAIEHIVENDVFYNQSMLVDAILALDDNSPLRQAFTWDNVENIEEAEGEEGETVYKEVYEWWLVSDWLWRKLRDEGEPVLENEYGYYWGRTCSGQMIAMDSVMENIARKLHEA